MKLNKSILLFSILLLLSSMMVFSDWCYQEYANESNSCGSVSGYYTGILDPEISCTSNNQDTCMIDGDWDTFQNSVGDGFDFYSIYNINSSVVGGIFQTKDDEFGISNYTLNDNCLFNNNGTLKIRITYSTIADPEEVGDDFHFQEIYCLDQNNNVRQTIDIRQYSGNENYYEDGINWNIVENPTYCYQESANISTSCGGKNTGYYNITGMDDPQLATDGDWTTYGINGVYRVIYDKPENVTTAKIQYECDGEQGVTTWNYTLNDDCLFNTNDFFQISINYNSGILTCRNSTSDIQYIIDPQYLTLEYEASTVTACDSGIYEEAIYWILPTSEEDTTPPKTITNLQNISATNDSIYWSWTNPDDIDFNFSIVEVCENIIPQYCSRVTIFNTSNDYYNFSPPLWVFENTPYLIKIRTVDISGNINETIISNETYTLSHYIEYMNLSYQNDDVELLFYNTNFTGDLSSALIIEPNFIEINDSRLDVPADITLTGLPYFTTPGIIHNGILDSNQTQYNLQYNELLRTAEFHVESWSNYSIGEMAIITRNSCQNTQGIIYAAFGLIALLLIVSAAFIIVQSVSGSVDMAVLSASVIGMIGLSIVLFIGYYIISAVGISVCI